MPQENVEPFKRFIDGFNRRDVEAMLEAVDAGVEWRPAAPVALGGRSVAELQIEISDGKRLRFAPTSIPGRPSKPPGSWSSPRFRRHAIARAAAVMPVHRPARPQPTALRRPPPEHIELGLVRTLQAPATLHMRYEVRKSGRNPPPLGLWQTARRSGRRRGGRRVSSR
jgi:hypothetical protein